MDKDILYSVYIKHETKFTSLTKKALAQIISKIIFLNQKWGISSTTLTKEVGSLTKVKIKQSDIELAIRELVIEGKVRSTKNKHFITDEYLPTISNAIEQSHKIHIKAVNKWFIKSSSGKKENGLKILENWLKLTLIEFFKLYKNNWIKDLRLNKKSSGHERIFIYDLIDSTLNLSDEIDKDDFEWLKVQFIGLLESHDLDDNNLIWLYGSSIFSAALITARNYADDFTIEEFKDSTFLLDTNILMVLGLEGSEHHKALKELELTFQNLHITPKYLHISEEEYNRAYYAKKNATINTLNEYGLNVLSKSDSNYLKTGLARGFRTVEEFEAFLEKLESLPTMICDTLLIEKIDYSELLKAIENSSNDEKVKSSLNKIHFDKTGRTKREEPLKHDAGLIGGAQFLRKENKCWILTRDNILRAYADEISIRNELPIALGIDSLIQMLSIGTGGTDESSHNYAPLFSRIVSSTLIFDKDVFKVEDLELILDSRVQIGELPDESVIEIAKVVNKLKAKDMPHDTIVLEIERYFRKSKSNIKKDLETTRSENQELFNESLRQRNKASSYRSELADSKFKEHFEKLRRKVNRDRLFLFAIIISFLLSIYCLYYFRNSNGGIAGMIFAIVTEFVGSFFVIPKFKLRITEVDKKDIKSKINEELNNLRN